MSRLKGVISHHQREAAELRADCELAVEAGISRESLYRTLSPKGNPTLKTVGLRLSVISEQRLPA